MLTVHNISKSYGIETVLQGISFSLNRGERIGLVGPNGCGKTTLLRILAGLDKPDTGFVQYDPPGLYVGYLPQGYAFAPEETIGSFLDRAEGELASLSESIEQLAAELTLSPDHPDLQKEYDARLGRLQILSETSGKGPSVLAALGLSHLPLSTPASILSGGQKTRLGLAGVLVSSPQLLLLDEPTNHLDLDMLEWLEDWLTKNPSRAAAATLVVSHDRAFLDNTVTSILELDPTTHTTRFYDGNYGDYLEEKLAERQRHWQEYADQQEEIARLSRAARRMRGEAQFKRGGKADSGDKFAKGFFANRGKETVRKAKNIERRIERLLTEEHVDKPHQSWQMKLDFGETPEAGKDVLMLENLSVGYGSNVILSDLNLQVRQGARLALVGPNGAGKTTLLRTIAGLLPPIAGRVRLGANVRIGYMQQEQGDLDPRLDAFTTIRNYAPLSETDARAFLHQFLFGGDDVFVPVRSLSFGERARLSLACLVAQGSNLLLLDEPINHLDIPSRARFEQALAGYEGTILAVVHDRYFIEGFAAQVWEVKERGIIQTISV
jgi:ATP-binding cassette subfamily F protein 3